LRQPSWSAVDYVRFPFKTSFVQALICPCTA
jgi:hypothetical protein